MSHYGTGQVLKKNKTKKDTIDMFQQDAIFFAVILCAEFIILIMR